MKVAIIGAGPTGLSAAVHLTKNAPNISIHIYEAAPVVGGLSRSFSLFDHIVDLGPHRFFTQDPAIFKFWNELAGTDCHKVQRQTRILYGSQYIGYPLRFTDIIRALPLRTKVKILTSYLQRRKHFADNGKNFATTMRYRFGDELYRIFFKDYTERLWGVSDEDLSASVAHQRIGRFGLGHALLHALRNTFNPVEDCFFYPTYGCGQVWERAAQSVREAGGQVHLSEPIRRIRKYRSGYQLSSDLGESTYDQIISTLPLSQLIHIYEDASQPLKNKVKNLQFRSTILVYVEVGGRPQFQDQWIYVHTKNIRTGRITNFSNWGVAQNARDTHVLCMEYWCDAGDEMWNQHDRVLADVACEDLKRLGYEPHTLHRTQVLRLPSTYPVITHESETLMGEIRSELAEHTHLQTVGRSGSFKYNNQDHCIEMGIRAAKETMGEKSDVWSVNSQNSYQESRLIQSTLPPG